MKPREISGSKIGPFSLACTDPYIGIGWEYQSKYRPNTPLKHFCTVSHKCNHMAGILEKKKVINSSRQFQTESLINDRKKCCVFHNKL